MKICKTCGKPCYASGTFRTLACWKCGNISAFREPTEQEINNKLMSEEQIKDIPTEFMDK